MAPMRSENLPPITGEEVTENWELQETWSPSRKLASIPCACCSKDNEDGSWSRLTVINPREDFERMSRDTRSTKKLAEGADIPGESDWSSNETSRPRVRASRNPILYGPILPVIFVPKEIFCGSPSGSAAPILRVKKSCSGVLKLSSPSLKNCLFSGKNSSKRERERLNSSDSVCEKSGLSVPSSARLEVSPYLRSMPVLFKESKSDLP